jgi:hypothetical protein
MDPRILEGALDLADRQTNPDLSHVRRRVFRYPIEKDSRLPIDETLRSIGLPAPRDTPLHSPVPCGT